MIYTKKVKSIFGLMILISFCSFLFIGKVSLFDWDEANFAELAREMIVSQNYFEPQINFFPFYEKPPLFIWIQVICMKLFGINEFAARFPNAILGVLVLYSLFHIGKKYMNREFGLIWVLCYGASLAPFFYFHTGLIDPLFNFFIFLSIYYFITNFNNEETNIYQTLLSALFAGLAVMTKGPVALILICGSLLLTWSLIKFRKFKYFSTITIWIIITLFVSSIWFIYLTHINGTQYLHEFIDYQLRLFKTEDAKHGGNFLFHPLVLFIGCFPASVLMWLVFQKNILKKYKLDSMFLAMASCFIVVILVFTLVKTKIIHYSSMNYYPISFFSALGVYNLYNSRIKVARWILNMILIITFLWILVIFLIPILGNHKEIFIQYIHDQYFLSQLERPLKWNYWGSISSLFVLFVFIYSAYLWKKKKSFESILLFFNTYICIIFIIHFFYISNIEKLTQGELVDFSKNIKNDNSYIQPMYIKSYLIYFYSDQKNINMNNKWTIDTFLNGKIDKNCYFVTRTIDTSKIQNFVAPMYSKYGLTFYLRKISN